jgi:hypothetical protein
MSAPAAVLRLRPTRPLVGVGQDLDRRVRRRVGIAWGLLLMNVLTFYPGLSFIPIPSVVGKGIQQGSLIAAFLVALSVNRRLLVRPNVYLCLVSLLAIETFVTALFPQHLGFEVRTLRLAGYVVTLWLLTPWWGRRDLLLVRCHLTALAVVIGSAVFGLLVSPGRALTYGNTGRLSGVVWPIQPTDLAQFTAVAIGLVAVLWLCGHLRGRAALLVVAVAFPVLLLTHTRTALAAMVAGLLVAGLSLIVVRARVRKLFAAAAVVTAIAFITLSSVISAWLERGQGSKQLTELTGRTLVWSALLNSPREPFQMIFGQGLSNDSFNGLNIDSTWLAAYNDQGLIGVGICVAILVFLLVAACFRPRDVRRALALFLVTYCLVASITEVGFASASSYLLELTLAASLLLPSAAVRGPP